MSIMSTGTGRLAGKSIVIVGGSSGMGLSAALACAAEGAQLVLVGRDADKCQRAVDQVGSQACHQVGDAADPDVVSRAVELAVQHYGKLDGLYHVAGGSGRKAGDGPLHELSLAGWEFTLRTNLTGLFHSNQAAVQQMLRQATGGSILNMSSVLGFAPSAHFFATHAYAASKAAAIGLSKAAAAYYAPFNIRCNVLAPALVATPMAERALGDLATIDYVRHRQPLDGGRVATPADVDQAAIYFLADESRFVTGQVLAVDGGWTVSG